jgi:membrane peptidoglycan carboxypeptidase
VPQNYDEVYHGNTLLRAALANSYNVPAVKALDFVAVEGLLNMADRLGVVSLSAPQEHCPEYPYEERPSYGLALTLGSGEAKLLEMVGAFAVLSNGGVRIPPTAIQYIESANGDLIADYRGRPGGRVISAQHAYLITHILSDREARCPAFGCPNTLQLDGDRAAAAKTGTTTDFRDAWTIGYTPELVTGVWVGNSDNTPMNNVPGSRGAGPIWKSFMTQALVNTPPSLFERPPGIMEQEICLDSGTSPSEYCPNRDTEVFSQDQPPLDASHDLWQAVLIDSVSGLRANEYCMENAVEKVFFVAPPEAREWAVAHGYEQPPEEFCSAESRPQVSITAPLHDEVVPQGKVSVYGQVQLPNFKHYDVLYGVGTNPQAMGWVSGPHLAQVPAGGLLTEWDTSSLSPGPYTLRVVAYTHDNVSVQAQVIVNVASFSKATVAPEPTPTLPPPTYAPPPTDTPLPTALPTDTPPPTALPTDTPSPTPEPGIEPTLEITPES